MIKESSSTAEISATMPLDVERNTLCLVVVGKSGTGKSTLCNQLALEDKFAVGHGLCSCTTELQKLPVNDELVVVDTSDDMQEVVSAIKPVVLESLRKVVIVFCIRCDSRFAVEEYSMYRELKDRWGDEADFRQRLIVAFTHGDSLDGDPHQAVREMLKITWPQVQAVVRDADNRFVVFGKQEEGNVDSSAVTELLAKARAMDTSLYVRPTFLAQPKENITWFLPIFNTIWRNNRLLAVVFAFCMAIVFFVMLCTAIPVAFVVLLFKLCTSCTFCPISNRLMRLFPNIENTYN